MTNVTITKDRARFIAKRAVDAVFDPKFEAHAEAEDALARAAYRVAYTAEEIAAAEAAPDGWIRRDSCLNYAVDGMRIKLTTQRDHFLVPYRTKFGSEGYYCHDEHAQIVGTDLSRQIVAHAHALEKLRTDRKETLQKLEAFVGSFRTVKKLAEAWPEGAPYYERHLQTTPIENLPAIPVDEINSILGLTRA